MNVPGSILLGAVFLSGFGAFASPASGTPRKIHPDGIAPPPIRTQAFDYSQRLDANELSMVVTNTGSFAYDLAAGGPGLEFPKGSGKTVVFAAGLWLGAKVGSETRLALADYSSEYLPGSIVGGPPDDPSRPEYKVYKLRRTYSSTAERDAVLSDYLAGAVPHGAPPVSVLPDGSLDITGDQMTWCVFNDADPSAHTSFGGGTAPLGVEVRQMIFSFDQPAPLGRVAYVRYQILNKGPNTLSDTHVGLWMDPDVGSFVDDLAGCAPASNLGFAFNAGTLDGVYGTQPPAVGVDLIQGPEVTAGQRAGLTAFATFILGTDPTSAADTYNRMRGLAASGDPIIDPITGIPTPYQYAGDPVTGGGWLDTAPADKRILLSSGPFTMAPGAEQEILYAVIVGLGRDHLASLARVKCDEPGIEAFALGGFAGPAPVSPPCQVVTACPWNADRWEQQFAGGGELSTDDLASLASCIGQSSEFLGWPLSVSMVRDFLAASNQATPAGNARREYTAVLANHCATVLRLPADAPIALWLSQPLACTGVSASDVGQLVQRAIRLVRGEYLDRNAAHPTPITGVNFGLSGFFGGADAMWNFLGAGPDPQAHPEAFPNVEIRFDRAHGQRAHRYLRLEQEGTGQAPAGGREYRYGGFREVPFTCWDVTHGVQLDVGFVERAVTDPYGTILGPSVQPATFDSTWSPDESEIGGREYLFVGLSPYTGAPNPNLAVDGAPVSGLELFSYALGARRTEPGTVFDDGDVFAFSFDFGPSSSVDANLTLLARLPAGDPGATTAYGQIAQCVEGVNGSRVACGPTTLRADAGPDVVGECGAPVRLDGRGSQGEGLTFAWSADGITFDDPTSPTPTADFPLGTTLVTLVVSDPTGIAFDQVAVTILDREAPILLVGPSPAVLWPPNGALVNVHAEISVFDACGEPTVTLASIDSDEPDAGTSDEDVPNDIQDAEIGTFDRDFRLRAERADAGDGRTYRVCYDARDAAGNTTRFCATVEVPHDRRGRAGLALGQGTWSVTIFGSPGMNVRSIVAGSIVAGTTTGTSSVPAGSVPSWGDVDRDGREDAVFVLAENSPPQPGAGEIAFVRWMTPAGSWLAEVTTVTGVPDPPVALEFEVSVSPNPARVESALRYAVPHTGHVRIRVFDVAGREVARLVDGEVPAGRHVARFRPRMPQLYLYTVEWEGMTRSGRFAVLR